MSADTTDRHDEPRRALEDSSASGDGVAAFVRLAEDSVGRLVSDPQVASRLRRSMVTRPDEGDLDRLMRAEQVLARVLCFERATVSRRPLSAADLESCLGRGRLDPEGQIRLIYELSLSGGRSWPAVESALGAVAAESDLHERPPASDADPVVLALLTLVSSRWRHRRPSVRRAARGASTDPLGFCRLLLEEADELGEVESGRPSALSRVSVLLDDPFLRRESPRTWFDLRARCSAYLADRSRRLGRPKLFEAQLEALSELLEAGTGDPDLRALEQELHAGRDLAASDRASARRRLLRAAELLRDVDPVDRRLEVQLKYALILAADPSTRHLAVQVLETAAGLFESLPRDVNPRLRLRLLHARARVELDLARQAVAEQQPLATACAQSPQSPSALDAYANAWRAQSVRLATARSAVQAADDLQIRHGSPRQRAEHRWYLGQSWLVADRGQAARHLRAALAEFRAIGDEQGADRVSIDLIVCSVVAGASGDELEDWSEPLRLFRQLAARTSDP